jgi:hypothetical protein
MSSGVSFDMRPLPSIKPWNRIANPQIFELARADYGTVVWPGEIDIAPEALFDVTPHAQRQTPVT